MNLYPVCWNGSKEEAYDRVDCFLDHISGQYPDLISVGGVFKAVVSKDPAKSLNSWTSKLDYKIRGLDGIGVTVVDLGSKTINDFSDDILFTYAAGFQTAGSEGSLIVIDEGVLGYGDPSESLFNSRKSKVGMHELLEFLLTKRSHFSAHNLISHTFISTGKTVPCVNNQDIRVFFNSRNDAEISVLIYDKASDHYCKERLDGLVSCEDRFKTSLVFLSSS